MAIQKKTNGVLPAIKTIAIATAGAYAGTKISDAVEKSLSKGGNLNANKIAPMVTAGIGLLGMIFAPEMIKPAFIGMSATAGAESLEKMMDTPAPAPAPAITQGLRIPAYNDNLNGLRIPAYNNVNGYRNY